MKRIIEFMRWKQEQLEKLGHPANCYWDRARERQLWIHDQAVVDKIWVNLMYNTGTYKSDNDREYCPYCLQADIRKLSAGVCRTHFCSRECRYAKCLGKCNTTGSAYSVIIVGGNGDSIITQIGYESISTRMHIINSAHINTGGA